MKLIAALIFTLFALGYSSSAYAISDEKLAAKCFKKGKAKISKQAELWGCQVDLDQTEVAEIDNRWYNPSKYVWYQVMGPCNGEDRIVQLVQYYKGKCF